MAVVAICLVLFLAMTGHSTGFSSYFPMLSPVLFEYEQPNEIFQSATYCICKDGVSDSLLQKDIDYACGAGADCSPILQNGACYNPNTMKDHCNYAVNSYYQKKGQATGSCDFAGTATTTQSNPSQNSACVFPASASSAGSNSTAPSTTPSTGTSPSSSVTPSTGTGGTTTPSSVFGLGPTGSGVTSSTDNSGAIAIPYKSTHLFWPFSLTLLLLGPMLLRL